MTPKESLRTVDNIKPSPKNPRKISQEELALLGEAMREFGDLSGIVVNRRTGRLVGGHQRIKNLNPAWKIEKHPAKDRTGTVALGHIKTPFGRWNYREVDWPEKQELAANLAANKIGGEWDDAKLAALLREIDDSPLVDLTGFDEEEINRIIADAEVVSLKEGTGRADTPGLSLVPYLGGKQATAPYLINMLPEHTSYVEVFGGGGISPPEQTTEPD